MARGQKSEGKKTPMNHGIKGSGLNNKAADIQETTFLKRFTIAEVAFSLLSIINFIF